MVEFLKRLFRRTEPGPYIPADLDDAIGYLEREMDQESRQRVMAVPNERGMAMFHFGSGMAMRNNWGLWHGSRLARWFYSQGIYHADDMSGIIQTSLWRSMHGKPIDLAGQVKHYQDFWAERGLGYRLKADGTVECFQTGGPKRTEP